ncbi:MAG: DUF1254 domain-containing protein [Planctomycetota bacterium]
MVVPLVVTLLAAWSDQSAAAPPAIRYAETPESILTPDAVKTRIGTLEFFDGYPSARTVQKVYNHLDFMRGTRVFLDAIPIASLHGMREGLRGVGCVDGTVGIFEDLMDSRSLFLTPNTESVYAVSWIDLRSGPVVIESPPNVLGLVNNAWFEYVTDIGNAGPDRGKGGKYLFVPPDWKGDLPDGYHTFRCATFGNWFFCRGFLVEGDPKPAVASMKARLRVYPLAARDNRPEQEFVSLSGRHFNTIHANDATFYEEVAEVIQYEPIDGLDPEFLGLLASIGIEKGKAFEPDTRMRKILADAAKVGNATARAIGYRNRDPEARVYKDGRWAVAFIGGSHEWLRDGVRLLDARTMYLYFATAITPAMSAKMIGMGSQYAGGMVDADGNVLDGGKTYRLHLPPNDDGSVTIWFGPKTLEGKEKNWIQTVPGKGWFTILRLYGPLEPWFDKTWKPGDIELVH